MELHGSKYKLMAYERMPNGYGCFYCGEPASGRDHCPPLVWADQFTRAQQRRDEVKFLLVPSCSHCNSILGSRALFTPLERVEYVAKRLEDMYERQAHLWSEDEIKGMSPMFQKSIRGRKRQLDALRDRVRAAQWRVARCKSEC